MPTEAPLSSQQSEKNRGPAEDRKSLTHFPVRGDCKAPPALTHRPPTLSPEQSSVPTGGSAPSMACTLGSPQEQPHDGLQVWGQDTRVLSPLVALHKMGSQRSWWCTGPPGQAPHSEWMCPGCWEEWRLPTQHSDSLEGPGQPGLCHAEFVTNGSISASFPNNSM